jgi:O-succinylbenzoate synthase
MPPSFKIHPICHHHEGLLLEGPDGTWGEVSPLPGRSKETLAEALSQLKAVQQGYSGPLLPSVAFGLFGLTAPRVFAAPLCLLLTGTLKTIYALADRPYGCTVAKVKIAPFDVMEAVELICHLKKKFRLRVDLGAKWDKEKLLSFLSHFSPADFEFIEDPGFDISPFPMAADEYSTGKIEVWKPTIKGVPPPKANVILSSSYETSIGLHNIAALDIPLHALGIGTFLYMEKDVLKERLVVEDGMVKFPEKLEIN